ncbi:MAG: hypothetical protein WA405_11250 [Candidatus Acidiferrales bacterium]
MTDKLDDARLCELTGVDSSFALAECIDGLGCTVYAGGEQLTAPWASYKVQELVGVHVRDRAVIGTQTKPQYFVLKRDQETDSFGLLHGPLGADELLAERTKVKRAGK